ncbi:hypothetical protein AMAG_08464 [Allomyces macrogynus ATCC 38327]|uniref:MARVEL domain-containing protein n=1 Tax=Allomyces macrogynus (strain ATCC 38327) TaxID=578462 RepID=A0A0L0SLR1_ALLM3|nr:hypothetical protein GGF32_005782 [Allomyces javanicus]KNE63325.1 hypothetical protein AMAG_08464 [Allomyces macrogynus ATCC 38327]|eukprot:KNE63325.1 hypothetical protein AMAG_08464 [Allomyces macrogynus ATCC 38327]
MGMLDTLYHRVTAHSARLLHGFFAAQVVVAVINFLLVDFNSIIVDPVTNQLSLCILYLNSDRAANPLDALPGTGCRVSIDSSIALIVFTAALFGYHKYVERSGKMTHNIYSNVQQRWYWSFAACGATVLVTMLVFAINTSAGLSSTCGAVDDNVNILLRRNQQNRIAPGTVSCSEFLGSDGTPRHARLSAAVALSWLSAIAWGGYVAMYVAAARSY